MCDSEVLCVVSFAARLVQPKLGTHQVPDRSTVSLEFGMPAAFDEQGVRQVSRLDPAGTPEVIIRMPGATKLKRWLDSRRRARTYLGPDPAVAGWARNLIDSWAGVPLIGFQTIQNTRVAYSALFRMVLMRISEAPQPNNKTFLAPAGYGRVRPEVCPGSFGFVAEARIANAHFCAQSDESDRTRSSSHKRHDISTA